MSQTKYLLKDKDNLLTTNTIKLKYDLRDPIMVPVIFLEKCPIHFKLLTGQ